MKRTAAAALGGKTIAQKIRTAIRKAPPGTADATRDDLQAHVAEARNRLHVSDFDNPHDRDDFADHAVGMAAMHAVLGALSGIPEIDKINRVIDEAHEEYMPGGPPMSPVHDSFFMTWSLVDLVFGRKRESVVRVVLQLADLLGLDDETRAAIERMSVSRLGLYRVQHVAPPKVGEAPILTVDELVAGRTLTLQFVEAFDIRAGDLLLVRPFEPREASARARKITHLAVNTPYMLRGHTDPEWTDYLVRQAADSKRRLDDDAYALIMQGHDLPRRWLEFIVDGFAGVRRSNAVIVEGIPDRPETLAHHRDYRPEDEHAIPPGTPDRQRATILSARLAQHWGTLLQRQSANYRTELGARFEALDMLGGDPEVWLQIVAPVALFQVGPSGQPPLVTSLDADTVDADARELIDAYLQGVTAVFEVIDIEPGKRMRVRDLLTAREYDVQERSGTMQMPARAVLLARLVEYRGIWLIDGWFPQPAPARLRDALVANIRKQLPPQDAALPHPLSTSDAIFGAMLAWQEVMQSNEQHRAQAPAPQLFNTSGDPIAWTTIALEFDPRRRFDVLDAIRRLRGSELEDDPEANDDEDTMRFVVLDRRDTLEAKLVVGPGALVIESNASARARRVLQRLRSKLPGVLRTVETTTTPMEELLASQVPGVREPPTPEHLAVIQGFFAQRYATFLDEPIPALRGKSPRAAAKDPALRSDLDALLREHESGLSEQCGPGVVDFDAMRRELDLTK